MKDMDNGGVPLYYETTGSEAGAPVALVKRLAYEQWVWRWQRERLTDETHWLVAPDARSMGDSETPVGSSTVEEMVSDPDAALADTMNACPGRFFGDE